MTVRISFDRMGRLVVGGTEEVNICVRVIIRCEYETINKFRSNREYFSYYVVSLLVTVSFFLSSPIRQVRRPLFCNSLTRIITNR